MKLRDGKKNYKLLLLLIAIIVLPIVLLNVDLKAKQNMNKLTEGTMFDLQSMAKIVYLKDSSVRKAIDSQGEFLVLREDVFKKDAISLRPFERPFSTNSSISSLKVWEQDGYLAVMCATKTEVALLLSDRKFITMVLPR